MNISERIEIKKLKDYLNQEVIVAGWIHVRRDHGKLIFLEVRDTTGIVQTVILPNNEKLTEIGSELRAEWVVKIKAKVNFRPEKMVKEGLNGNLELEALEIEVLNKAKALPFEIVTDTSDIAEDVRLKYRYLDLRSERMQKNIRVRSEFVRQCRDFLFNKNFTEIETPILTESTPEGSRDFVVPSRINKGKFYALPQSPQQYKQMLMTAGFEKYFQVARCIRDEDLRADRGFEHTQIDIEQSFVNREDVMGLVEEMIIEVVEKMGYEIKEKPFPVIGYQEAMEKYGADKFDLRTAEEKERGILSYAWVVDFPQFEKTPDGKWTFSHNPFSAPQKEFEDDLLAGKNIENILSTQYDLVCNGSESGGGSIRSHKPEVLEAVYKIMGHDKDEIEKKVGHMMEAYSLGTPPHGGIALGVERNIMNLTGESTLRDTQAFPMTRSGQTSVMNGPSELSEKQLKELGLQIKNK